MSNGRDLPDRVQWTEGMLLAPQHFQQADLRAESLLHYHVGVAAPFHWGIRRLRVNPVLLATGTFRVTELEAILPDGLLVTAGGGAGEDLSLELAPHAEGKPRGTLTVHLAVPKLARELPRYRSVEGAPVADENGEGQALVVPRLRPSASLLFGDSVADKYSSFPLARVSFQEETFSLTDFIPPLLEVTAKTELGAACGRLATRLRERASFLSEQIRSVSAGSGEGGLAERQRKLEQLVAGLPALEAVLAVPSHPFVLYLSLASVAGQLAGISPGTVPPSFRAYDHNDLRATFGQLLTFCARMVEGIQQLHEVVPFHLEEGAFHLQLKSEWSERALIVGVTAGAEMPEAEVVPWMTESRIGSVAAIPSIRDRRIRGATRRQIERDDDLGVFPSRGTQLFRVEPDPEFVRPGETLEISHPAHQTGKSQPAEIVLYAPMKQ